MQRSRFARSFGKSGEHNLLQKTQCKCGSFSVSCAKPGLVPPRVAVCVSLKTMTQRRSWRMLAVKPGLGPIRVCTTAGQSGTTLDPKLLPEQPCDPGVRELSGSLLFLSRCKRFDISFVTARLARFVTRYAGAYGLERKSGTSSVLSHTQLNGLTS